MVRNSENKEIMLTPDEDTAFQEFVRLEAHNIYPLIRSLKNCNMTPERVARAFLGLEEKKMILCLSDSNIPQYTDKERETIIKQIASEYNNLI